MLAVQLEKERRAHMPSFSLTPVHVQARLPPRSRAVLVLLYDCEYVYDSATSTRCLAGPPYCGLILCLFLLRGRTQSKHSKNKARSGPSHVHARTSESVCFVEVSWSHSAKSSFVSNNYAVAGSLPGLSLRCVLQHHQLPPLVGNEVPEWGVALSSSPLPSDKPTHSPTC